MGKAKNQIDSQNQGHSSCEAASDAHVRQQRHQGPARECTPTTSLCRLVRGPNGLCHEVAIQLGSSNSSLGLSKVSPAFRHLLARWTSLMLRLQPNAFLMRGAQRYEMEAERPLFETRCAYLDGAFEEGIHCRASRSPLSELHGRVVTLITSLVAPRHHPRVVLGPQSAILLRSSRHLRPSIFKLSKGGP